MEQVILEIRRTYRGELVKEWGINRLVDNLGVLRFLEFRGP